MATYVYDETVGKMVLKSERTRVNRSAMVMAPHKDFVSPIDGKLISSRRQLDAHNKHHGVTNSADYSGGYIDRKAKERVNEGQKQLNESRRQDLHDTINRYN